MREVFIPSFLFSMCMESNSLKKSTNNGVASKYFACTPSMI